MAIQNPRISKSGVTTTGRIPLYSNSPEIEDADPSLVRLVRGNSLSALYLSGGDLSAEEINLEGELVVSEDDNSESGNDLKKLFETFRTAIPNISDISIISNTVVYDAAGNPSVTLVFKIKNSSGETLKGMNAKVELV